MRWRVTEKGWECDEKGRREAVHFNWSAPQHIGKLLENWMFPSDDIRTVHEDPNQNCGRGSKSELHMDPNQNLRRSDH